MTSYLCWSFLLVTGRGELTREDGEGDRRRAEAMATTEIRLWLTAAEVEHAERVAHPAPVRRKGGLAARCQARLRQFGRRIGRPRDLTPLDGRATARAER